ncbi:hypothetical protein IGJ91_002249 [Enterococcus sp. DIV0765f]|uniref:hypothetical protein n=1 Tax=Enterococcus TaxID=1350 RepID=UPI001FBABB84|nr:hypothetical protein [Enterococcus mundtii]GKS55480.1 hypothetical protein EMLAB_20950 [Enterococcus mundtii]
MPFSEPLSIILKRDYGFSVFPANPIQRDYEIYEEVRERLKCPDLPFRPIVDVCYERKLSMNTYLIIEALCIRNKHGAVIRQTYSFYKASYFYKNVPQKLKLYCEDGNRKDILNMLQKFNFLKE